jgi:hypothetical protein
MIDKIFNGLKAGLVAGLVLALLFFLDYGPGNLLHNPARWLGLDSQDAGKIAGFFLLIVLGGLFGLLFGIFQSRRETTRGRSLLLGAITGVLFWLIVPFLFGTLIHHWQLNLSSFLSSFVPLLLYGVLLGAFFFQGLPRVEQTAKT